MLALTAFLTCLTASWCCLIHLTALTGTYVEAQIVMTKPLTLKGAKYGIPGDDPSRKSCRSERLVCFRYIGWLLG